MFNISIYLWTYIQTVHSISLYQLNYEFKIQLNILEHSLGLLFATFQSREMTF